VLRAWLRISPCRFWFHNILSSLKTRGVLIVSDQIALHDTGVIRLHPSDNVVVAAHALPAGTKIARENVTTLDAIPFGHKIATRAIAKGEPVRKYGQVMGVATQDIAAGAHVHVQNCTTSDLREVAGKVAAVHSDAAPRTVLGYKRPAGRVGTRNYVAVLTSVNCSATVAKFIAEQAQKRGLLDTYPNIDGIFPIVHQSGCGMASQGELYDLLVRTLWGTANNPNFAAVLLVGLGCEVPQIARIAKDYNIRTGPHFQSFTIQDAGGTRRATGANISLK